MPFMRTTREVNPPILIFRPRCPHSPPGTLLSSILLRQVQGICEELGRRLPPGPLYSDADSAKKVQAWPANSSFQEICDRSFEVRCLRNRVREFDPLRPLLPEQHLRAAAALPRLPIELHLQLLHPIGEQQQMGRNGHLGAGKLV